MSHLAQRNVLAAYLGLVCLMGTGLFKGCELPDINLPVVVTPDMPEATRAVYVHEQRDNSVPPAVNAALDKLNRQGFMATATDDDVTDGNGNIPKQYATAIPAAREAGLPCLVVLNGDEVLKIVPAPTTEEAVMEAVQ